MDTALLGLNNWWHCVHFLYNHYRPHQGKGIGNKVLDKSFVPQTEGVLLVDQRGEFHPEQTGLRVVEGALLSFILPTF